MKRVVEGYPSKGGGLGIVQVCVEVWHVKKFCLVPAAAGADSPGHALRSVTGLESWPVPWPWLVLGAAAALLALAGALWSLRRRGRKPRPAPVIPAHVKAFRSLQDLLAKGWIESGEAEPYYVALSGIVRRYIEDRFQIRAPECTTDEFIRAAAASTALTPDQRRSTADFLEQSDLVKFARHEPGAEAMRAAYAAAWRLVEDTRAPDLPSKGGRAA